MEMQHIVKVFYVEAISGKVLTRSGLKTVQPNLEIIRFLQILFVFVPESYGSW